MQMSIAWDRCAGYRRARARANDSP